MTPSSPLYLLERFDVGIVHLDDERRVVAMNDLARRILPVADMQPFDRIVLGFHPERSRPKVEFMLDQAVVCPVSNPPPMTMIINIPERVLLIKVTRLSDGRSQPTGYILVFYDITEIVAAGDAPAQGEADQHRRLSKIPTVSGQRLLLVDADDVLHLYSEGHYTHVVTTEGTRFCNLSLGDLQARLDPERFVRVHRGHIVRLAAIEGLSRDAGRLMIQLGGQATAVPVSRTSAADLLKRLGMSAVAPTARR